MKLNNLVRIDDLRRKMELKKKRKKDLYAWSRAYVRDERKNLLLCKVFDDEFHANRAITFFNTTDWFFWLISFVSCLYIFFILSFFFRNIKWSLLAKQKFVTPRIYISFFLFMFVLNFKFIKIEFQFSKFHRTLLIFTRFSLNTCLIAYANANRTMSPRGK